MRFQVPTSNLLLGRVCHRGHAPPVLAYRVVGGESHITSVGVEGSSGRMSACKHLGICNAGWEVHTTSIGIEVGVDVTVVHRWHTA